MNVFISNLLADRLIEAKKDLDEILETIIYDKLDEKKQEIASQMFGDAIPELVFEGNKKSNVLKMGRTKVIRVRVRKGKIQRRKKFSAVKGYTIRAGKLVRMMPAERRHRKIGARRSKFKRRAKLRTSIRKRKISLRKRRAIGL